MQNTLEMIAGKLGNLQAYEAYTENSGDRFIAEIKKSVEASENETVVIVTDVLGGSVNNEMTQLLATHDNVYLISGMNFPLLITLATQVREVTKEDILAAIEAGKQGIVLVNDLIAEDDNNEEDLL
jgi:fructoselysine and glucoselysine-specific PTS system IIA component